MTDAVPASDNAAEAPTSRDVTRGARPAAWPAFVAVALVLLAVAGLYRIILARTQGEFTYCLDDTYIHLAIAKNLAAHGVWGVTQQSFSGASSSPLWTVLLTVAFLVFGNHAIIPLVLNLLILVGVVFALHALWSEQGFGGWPLAALLVATALATSCFWLTFVATEHLLQVLLVVLVCRLALGEMRTEQAGRRPGRGWLPVLGALLVATRFEGYLLLVALGLLFALWRCGGRAVTLLAAGLAPVLLYGAFSVSQGGTFLPASVLVKGLIPGVTLLGRVALGLRRLVSLGGDDLLAALIIVSLLLVGFRLVAKLRCAQPHELLAPCFLLTAAMHLPLVGVYQNRYESYLIVLGLLGLTGTLAAWLAPGGAWHRPGLRWGSAAPLVLLLALTPPWLSRTKNSLLLTPAAAQDIHDQQRQMARFIGRYYPHDTIVCNDVGCIGYFTEAPVVDLAALATPAVTEAWLARDFSAARLQAIATAQHARTGVLYDTWLAHFYEGRPPWFRAGGWTLPTVAIAGDTTVGFYALQRGDVEELRGHLREFQPTLPPQVQVDLGDAPSGGRP
ncbi:MAG: hypothetical protein KKI08_25785 [Armatimonadetes bacterium]|nr:hypothetical protein [Armatimonadota bacterium]